MFDLIQEDAVYLVVIQQAATACNIPLVSLYDEFNEVTHDEDPREKGYISSDGIHTSDTSQQAISDLLRDAGYKPVKL